jgi:uncharacterized membrane protein YozB (DUF420 family)
MDITVINAIKHTTDFIPQKPIMENINISVIRAIKAIINSASKLPWTY